MNLPASPSFEVPTGLRRRRPRRRAAVSLTPLIDVVFILLVFFMLASSFIDWRSVELGAAGAARGGGIEGAMLVDLRPDDLRLAGEPMSLAQLAERLAARLETHPEQRIIVRPRDGADMQRLADLLDRLEAVGARDVLLSDPRSGAR